MTAIPAARRPALERVPPGLPEQIFAILGLLVLAGGILPLFRSGAASSSTLVATTIICLAAGVLLQVRGSGVTRLVTQLDVVVALLLVFITMSILWSVDPGLTARRAAAVLLYTIFGLYLVDLVPLREQPWLITRTVGIAAVASVLVAVVLPRYGVMPGNASEWRGIFEQKNVLGRVMGIGVFSAMLSAAFALSRNRRWWSLGVAATCALVLVQASSIFALVSLLVAPAPVVALWLLKRRYPLQQALVVVVVVLVLVASILTVEFRDSLLAAAGRDSELTGRVPLWTSCWHAVQAKPWFGYGYGAFWQGWKPPSTQVLLENPWGPPHAHNGPLDLALGIGMVGAALWLATLARALIRGAQVLVRDRSGVAVWAIGVPLLILAYNITEVTTTANPFFWSLFVAVSTSLRISVRSTAQAAVKTEQARRYRGTSLTATSA